MKVKYHFLLSIRKAFLTDENGRSVSKGQEFTIDINGNFSSEFFVQVEKDVPGDVFICFCSYSIERRILEVKVTENVLNGDTVKLNKVFFEEYGNAN